MCDKTYNVHEMDGAAAAARDGDADILRWRASAACQYGEQVVGTITAVDTFLGVILGITTAQYKQKQKTDAA